MIASLTRRQHMILIMSIELASSIAREEQGLEINSGLRTSTPIDELEIANILEALGLPDHEELQDFFRVSFSMCISCKNEIHKDCLLIWIEDDAWPLNEVECMCECDMEGK